MIPPRRMLCCVATFALRHAHQTTTHSLQAAGAALGGAAKSYRLERVAVCLSGFPGADDEQAQHSEAAQQGQQQHAPAAAAAAAAAAAFVAAALVGLYDGSAPYKSKFERKARLAELQLCGAAADAPGVAAAAARGVAYARGTLMARWARLAREQATMVCVGRVRVSQTLSNRL